AFCAKSGRFELRAIRVLAGGCSVGGDVLRNVDHRGVAAEQPRRRLYAPADPGADDDAVVVGIARPYARIVDLTDLDDLTVVARYLRPDRRVGVMHTIEQADLVTRGRRHPAGAPPRPQPDDALPSIFETPRIRLGSARRDMAVRKFRQCDGRCEREAG